MSSDPSPSQADDAPPSALYVGQCVGLIQFCRFLESLPLLILHGMQPGTLTAGFDGRRGRWYDTYGKWLSIDYELSVHR